MQVCKKIQSVAFISPQSPVPVKSDLSKDALDLIQKLLEKDPEKRIGYKNDSKEIKDHPFFASINWEDLAQRKIDALFKPNVGQDKLYCFKKMKQQGGALENKPETAEPSDSFDENKLPGFTYHADTFKEKLKNIDME